MLAVTMCNIIVIKACDIIVVTASDKNAIDIRCSRTVNWKIIEKGGVTERILCISACW